MTPPGKRACYACMVGLILVSCASPGRPQPTPVASHPFLPRPGTQALKILTSTTLEVDSLESWPVGPIPEVNPSPPLRVSLDGQLQNMTRRGCRRRVLDMPPVPTGQPTEALLQTSWIVQLQQPVHEGQRVEVALAEASKRAVRAGWFFPTDQAFDLLVADLIQPSPAQAQALWSQIDYSLGCNPNSLAYLTGLARYPLEVVSQYARNSPGRLPPTGLLVSCVQEGFPRLHNLGALSWPPDNQQPSGYPLLQRWGDCFNPATEATVENQAKALALLAAFTPAGSAPSEAALQLVRSTQGEWSVAAPPPVGQFVWEAPGQISTQSTFVEHGKTPPWLQLDVHFEDGRRAFGVWP